MVLGDMLNAPFRGPTVSVRVDSFLAVGEIQMRHVCLIQLLPNSETKCFQIDAGRPPYPGSEHLSAQKVSLAP